MQRSPSPRDGEHDRPRRAARDRYTSRTLATGGLVVGLVSLALQLMAPLMMLVLSRAGDELSPETQDGLFAVAGLIAITLLGGPAAVLVLWAASFGMILIALVRVGDEQEDLLDPAPRSAARGVMAGALAVTALQGTPLLSRLGIGLLYLSGSASTSIESDLNAVALATLVVVIMCSALIVAHGVLLARLRALGLPSSGRTGHGATSA